MLNIKLTMQSFWPCLGVKIWKSSFKSYKQKSEWNCQAELYSSLSSTTYNGYHYSSKPNTVTLKQNISSLIFPLCSGALTRPAKLSKRPSFAWCISSQSISQIDYLQATTDGAIDALSCHRPACCKDKAIVATDALHYRLPRKTFALSCFQALRSWVSYFRASLLHSWTPHFETSLSHFGASPSKFDSHISSLAFSSFALSSLSFPSLALTFLSFTLTFLSLTFTSTTFRASLFLSLAFTYLNLILLALYISSTLIPLHQILVCGTLVLSWLCQCDVF